MLTTGTRVQHRTNGKVGTVKTVGTLSPAGNYSIRVAWDGSRASVLYAENVRPV